MARLIGYLVFIGIVAYFGSTLAEAGTKTIGVSNYAQHKLLNEI